MIINEDVLHGLSVATRVDIALAADQHGDTETRQDAVDAFMHAGPDRTWEYWQEHFVTWGWLSI